jgi:ABC-type sugar transport system ATPase subunit
MARLVLERLTKVYPGNVRAVSGLDLEVADGELLAVLGPSGCGKTTLLRLVAGFEEPSEGRIVLGGRALHGVRPEDREVAMVFQSHALFPHLTAYQNLAFGLRRKLPREEIDRSVREIAALLCIEGLLGRRPGALSGGERQRVALGRAMVRRPAVFLLDEPLSSLDASLRAQMRAELKRLHRERPTTTVYVTHDQEEAMALGDRVAVLAEGLLEQVGTPLEVYDRPVNRFVAGFLGKPPMNFLRGRLRSDGAPVFEWNGGRFPWSGPELPTPAGGRERELLLGFRPEHLTDRPPAGAGGAGATIGGRVLLVEPLGDRADVHLLTGTGEVLVGRLDARSAVREGEEIVLHADLRRAHLFDPAQGGLNLASAEGSVRAGR